MGTKRRKNGTSNTIVRAFIIHGIRSIHLHLLLITQHYEFCPTTNGRRTLPPSSSSLSYRLIFPSFFIHYSIPTINMSHIYIKRKKIIFLFLSTKCELKYYFYFVPEILLLYNSKPLVCQTKSSKMSFHCNLLETDLK